MTACVSDSLFLDQFIPYRLAKMRVFVTFEGKKSRCLEHVCHCIHVDVQDMKTVYDFLVHLKRKFKLKDHYYLCLTLKEYFIADCENIRVLQDNDFVQVRVSKLNERISPYPELKDKRHACNDTVISSQENMSQETVMETENFDQNSETLKAVSTECAVTNSQEENNISLNQNNTIDSVSQSSQITINVPVGSSTPSTARPANFFLPRKFQLKPVAPRAKINMGSMALSSNDLNSRKDRIEDGSLKPYDRGNERNQKQVNYNYSSEFKNRRADSFTKWYQEKLNDEDPDFSPTRKANVSERSERRVATRSQKNSEEVSKIAEVNESSYSTRSKTTDNSKPKMINFVKEVETSRCSENEIQPQKDDAKTVNNGENVSNYDLRDRTTSKLYPKYKEIKKGHIKFDDDEDIPEISLGCSETEQSMETSVPKVDYTPIEKPVYVEPPLLVNPNATYEIHNVKTKTVGDSQSSKAKFTRTKIIDSVIDAYNKKMDAALGGNDEDKDEDDDGDNDDTAENETNETVLALRNQKVRSSIEPKPSTVSENALKSNSVSKVLENKLAKAKTSQKTDRRASIESSSEDERVQKPTKSPLLKPAPGLNIVSVVSQLNKELFASSPVQKTVVPQSNPGQRDVNDNLSSKLSQIDKASISQTSAESLNENDVNFVENTSHVSSVTTESVEEMLQRSKEFVAKRQSNLQLSTTDDSDGAVHQQKPQKQFSLEPSEEGSKKRKASEDSDIEVVQPKIQDPVTETSSTLSDIKRVKLDISDDENAAESEYSDSGDTSSDEDEKETTGQTVKEVNFSIGSSSKSSTATKVSIQSLNAAIKRSSPPVIASIKTPSNEANSVKGSNASISLPNGTHKIVTTNGHSTTSVTNRGSGFWAKSGKKPNEDSSSDESTSEDEAEIKANIRRTNVPTVNKSLGGHNSSFGAVWSPKTMMNGSRTNSMIETGSPAMPTSFPKVNDVYCSILLVFNIESKLAYAWLLNEFTFFQPNLHQLLSKF